MTQARDDSLVFAGVVAWSDQSSGKKKAGKVRSDSGKPPNIDPFTRLKSSIIKSNQGDSKIELGEKKSRGSRRHTPVDYLKNHAYLKALF